MMNQPFYKDPTQINFFKITNYKSFLFNRAMQSYNFSNQSCFSTSFLKSNRMFSYTFIGVFCSISMFNKF